MKQSQILSQDQNTVLMDFAYLYSTKDRDNLEQYFKLKEKYDYTLSNDELEALKNDVKAFGHYDVVLHPETTGKYLHILAAELGEEVVCIQKNDKETIKSLVSEQKMMKAERNSLMACIDNDMAESFQINKVKGNQRKRFKDILFKQVDLSQYKDKKVLLLDDSVFSGETLVALKEFVNIDCDVRVLYSKF